MADVEVYDAAYVEALEASVVVGGSVNGAGQLVLVRGSGEEFNAGSVVLPRYLSYGVGDLFITTTDSPAATILGGGTWERYGKGRVLVSYDDTDADFDTVNEIGGEKKHDMTLAELVPHDHQTVAHNHAFGMTGIAVTGGPTLFPASGSTDMDDWDMSAAVVDVLPTGGGDPFNVMQPYIVVFVWRRTA